MTPGLPTTAIVVAVSAWIGLLGATALRVGVRPLGFWLLAWSALFGAAGCFLATHTFPALRPVVFLFGAFAAPLMLAGAFEHVGRRAPSWLPAVGIGMGAVGVAAHQLGVPEFGTVSTAIVDSTLGALAVALVAKAARGTRRARGDHALAITLALYSVGELLDPLARQPGQSSWSLWGLWVALVMPLFATQVTSYFSRIGRSAIRSQRRDTEYTERLRILTEKSSSILVEMDSAGTLTYLSPNAEPLMKAKVEDVIGRHASDFFPITGDLVIKEAIEQRGELTEADVRDSPVPIQRARTPAGEDFYYEAHRTAYRTPSGALRILTEAHDVTDRIEREREIRESARRLNRAEEIGQFGSWEFYPREGLSYWSDHLYRMHGFEPRSGPVGRERVYPLIYPDDLERIQQNFRGLLDGRMFSEFVFRIRRDSDGATRHFKAMGEAEYDENGEIQRVSGASIDVTEQLELEATLRRGREHLERFVDANIVGVYYARFDGTIADANGAFLTALGYAHDELPLLWRAITPVEGRDRDDAALRDLARSGTALPYEKEFIAKSGETLPMLVAAARIDEDHALVIALDISERKRAEAFVAAHQRRLEDTISERTEELLRSRTRLLESQRLAAIGTLAAGVAHQINNPIGAILNSAEFALLCADDADAIDVFQQALLSNRVEARRCARIVKSMLQFSRDEPTEKWEEDLDGIIHHAHRATSAYAQDRHASVAVHLPARPLRARINPIEIEQVIVNVLRNAIESSDRGVRVELSLRQQGDDAEIEVVDDGAGIEEKDLERLFDPFFSTRTRQGGTGLGLSVAHGIVRDHAGEIRVDSEPDVGTRVVIRLPQSSEKPAD